MFLDSFTFVVLEVLWKSWICKFIHSTSFIQSFATISSNILFISPSIFPFWGSNYACILGHLKIFHCWKILRSLFFIVHSVINFESASLALSSWHYMLSSAETNLLFISIIVVLIYRDLVCIIYFTSIFNIFNLLFNFLTCRIRL